MIWLNANAFDKRHRTVPKQGMTVNQMKVKLCVCVGGGGLIYADRHMSQDYESA